MKKGFFSRLVSGFISSMLCFTAVPTFTSNAADQQELGNKDGYDYELWNQWGQGTATMDVGSNGSFSCSWDGIENCLFRTGQKLGSTKSYDEYNGMYIDYDVDYEPKGNSYMCVYGWTEDPTVEYYIVEAWGSWRPPGSNDTLGTVEANGNTYDIYRTVRENQPSIHGTETFYQYWSVRQDNPAQNNVKKHIEGRISVSEHFEAWEKAGLDMSGKMYEVALNIEGYQSNGSAVVNKNGLVIGEGDGDNGSVVTPITPIEPDENGVYFDSTFDSDTDGWGSRGDAVVALDTKNRYSGSSSLFVSGRTDNWNGTAISLDSSAFIPGNAYSFAAAVLQKSGEATTMKLTLQYTLNGEDNYDEVASVNAKSGEWTKLENTSFTIPTGAKNLLLYVEAPDSLTDFYIDSAFGAKEGTRSTVKTGGGTVDGVATTTSATTTNTIPTATTTTTAVSDIIWGDANEDGVVDIADAAAIIQHLGNKDKYALSAKGTIQADVDGEKGVTGMDALTIQKLVAGMITSIPVGGVPDITVPSDNPDISWIDPTKPMVAISFDDGAVGNSPNDSSMRIINAISDSGFHSTFFYVGNWINNSGKEAEVVYAYNKGMEIANHTTSHPYLTEKSASEIRSEYDTTYEKLKSIIGTEPSKLLRLPYLASNDTVTQTLSDVPMITCSIDFGDWNNATTDDIINTIVTAKNNGSLDGAIVLAHETYDTTAEAMEYLAPYLKDEGWQIVTVSEMFAVKNQELNGGQIYRKVN
ncbi:MAG: glycoside hydrolase family 11 protein [Ruminococcus flavefaciens]|nr:glycoside hydrolase family 11 protein [Ruminococcus flavefaciens]MCM1230330.1 glycoside hydrolase family 11 protein [Ruminococcus flavefaciens]